MNPTALPGLPAGDDTAFDPRTGASSLPCAETLVAGTVALMTTWADPCPHCRVNLPTQRGLMARKIVSNLFYLREHPALSPGLRQVMSIAHDRWAGVARTCEAEPTGPHERDEPADATARPLH